MVYGTVSLHGSLHGPSGDFPKWRMDCLNGSLVLDPKAFSKTLKSTKKTFWLELPPEDEVMEIIVKTSAQKLYKGKKGMQPLIGNYLRSRADQWERRQFKGKKKVEAFEERLKTQFVVLADQCKLLAKKGVRHVSFPLASPILLPHEEGDEDYGLVNTCEFQYKMVRDLLTSYFESQRFMIRWEVRTYEDHQGYLKTKFPKEQTHILQGSRCDVYWLHLSW